MMRKLFAAIVCLTIIPSAGFAEDISQQPVEVPAKQQTTAAGGLTLNAAIARALARSPRIQSFEAARQSTQGQRRQAGVWQNPEIGVQAENIAGQDDYRGFNSAEITYGVSQLVEIGGKRDARVAIADRSIDLADLDYQAARLDLVRDVTQAFAEAASAEEEVKIAQEQQNLAGDVLQSVTKRVDAAREPLIQKSKANVALATSRIALEKAQRDYDAALKILGNLMGEGVGVNRIDTGSFYEIKPPLEAADVKAAIERNPDITRWKQSIAKSEAEWELEKANAVPDPRINVGVRDFRNTDSKAFVVGVSIPLPILNSNQGNIAKAGAEVTKTKVDQKVSELSLGSEFVKALQAQQVAYAQATTLKDAVVPEAEHAFSLSRQGYTAGKFAYLEVLDAQRTLADARLQYVEALKEYHVQRANVERLTATHLQTPATPEESHD